MPKEILRIEEIIKGCKTNQNKCKELLYKQFYGYLMGIILRYSKNASDSEELVNDSFIKIFKAIPTFIIPNVEEDTIKYFKAWIGKIASRTAIDRIRLSKVHLYVDELTEIDHPVEEISSVSNLYVKDINNLLNQLPDLHRVIFNLYEIEGFKHEEIGELLKIPENSSRVYLTRAKNKLRQLYLNSENQIHQSNERRIN